MEKLFEMLKKLFSKMFGGGSFGQENKVDPQKMAQNFDQMSKELASFRDQSLEKGDILKAYAAETQRLGMDTMASQIAEGKHPGNNHSASAQKAMETITERLNDLNSSDAVKSAFQDYQNHDRETLMKAHADVNEFSNSVASGLDWQGMGNDVRHMTKELSNASYNHMTQRPKSPAEEAGLIPDAAQEKNNPQPSQNRDLRLDDLPSMRP